jgi:hypothetical protein
VSKYRQFNSSAFRNIFNYIIFTCNFRVSYSLGYLSHLVTDILKYIHVVTLFFPTAVWLNLYFLDLDIQSTWVWLTTLYLKFLIIFWGICLYSRHSMLVAVGSEQSLMWISRWVQKSSRGVLVIIVDKFQGHGFYSIIWKLYIYRENKPLDTGRCLQMIVPETTLDLKEIKL